MFLQAVSEYRQVNDPHSAAVSQLNAAVATFCLGHLEQAQTDLNVILEELFVHAGAEAKVNALRLAAMLHIRREEHGEAEARLREALNTAKQNGLRGLAGACLEMLGACAMHPREKLRHSSDAVRLLRETAAKAQTEPERMAMMAAATAPAANALDAAVELGETEMAWQLVQVLKAPVLSELMATPRRQTTGAGRPWAHGTLAEAVEKLSLAEQPTSILSAEELEEARYVHREIEGAARANTSQLRPPRGSLREVDCCRIKEGTLVLDYVLRGSDVLIFAACKSGLQLRRAEEAFGEDEAKHEVQTLYRMAAMLGQPVDPSLVVERLWRVLVSPVTDLLEAAANVVIIPHGLLHFLPIQAAACFGPNHKARRYLGEWKPLLHAPSVAVVEACESRARPESQEALVFANPVTDPASNLPYSEEEGKGISDHCSARLFPPEDCRSEVLLREMGARPLRFLHISSHGAFNAKDPIRSGIVMSDRTVTVAEVFASRIDCDLVFLNACSQGRGALAGPGEVLGMVRSFLHAGARSVISAMWPIHDKCAADIALRFYEAWEPGKCNKAAALQEALAPHKVNLPNWAAFRLHGAAD